MVAGWIICGLAVVLVTGWGLWLRRWRRSNGERLEATTKDGWRLAVWHQKSPNRRFREPVILCHGLANNHRVHDLPGDASLAHALTVAGFDCYLVDLRTTLSARAPRLFADVTFDDLVTGDVPALVEAIRVHAKSEHALWVGHSLGGLLALASQPPALKGLVTVGSPVFYASHRWGLPLLRSGAFAAGFGRLRIDWFSAVLAPFVGWWPWWLPNLPVANLRQLDGWVQRGTLAAVMAPIPRGLLRQFARWVKDDSFCSLDGVVDYRARIGESTIPALVVGGVRDAISPVAAVKQHHALVAPHGAELLLVGTEFGHKADAGHGDLMLGRDAATEVFPRIAAWLSARATPLGAGARTPPLAPGAAPLEKA